MLGISANRDRQALISELCADLACAVRVHASGVLLAVERGAKGREREPAVRAFRRPRALVSEPNLLASGAPAHVAVEEVSPEPGRQPAAQLCLDARGVRHGPRFGSPGHGRPRRVAPDIAPLDMRWVARSRNVAAEGLDGGGCAT